MSHVIQQLTELIVGHLTDATDAGGSVYHDRDNPIEADLLPAIEVTYLSDTPSDEGVMGSTTRDVEIEVRIVNRSTNSQGRPSVMDIRAQIEKIYNGCTVTMDGKYFNHVLNECEWDVDAQAEHNSYELTMNYQFQVRWGIGAPEVFT